jgi:hypothetical protein
MTSITNISEPKEVKVISTENMKLILFWTERKEKPCKDLIVRQQWAEQE